MKLETNSGLWRQGHWKRRAIVMELLGHGTSRVGLKGDQQLVMVV